ncbi:PREDICTED: methylmalonyl-CoA mutase, mitochondrial-like [Priapulus caudatus]|uniref:Methylmalonyl-CoA mutase, mitochondrial-like n=1 Tax=Priapulus caudatus TaxID=37621 RepID=A0ABM1EMT3_PRICU|nr:PREDICTED: methylmalonyl-CoA mutase, mitochondrial-like [Priapulus caudatus]
MLLYEEEAPSSKKKLVYNTNGLDAGLSIADFAPRLSFFCGVGMNFYVDIAKLRAAHWLWAHMMEETFAPTDPRSKLLRIHRQTSKWTITKKESYHNGECLICSGRRRGICMCSPVGLD